MPTKIPAIGPQLPDLEEMFKSFEAPSASGTLPAETGFAEGEPERRDPFDAEAGAAGPAPPKPPREMPPPPGSATEQLASKEAGLDTAVESTPVLDGGEVNVVTPPQAEQLPQDPTQGQEPEMSPMDQLEKRWLDMYDIGAKDLVGEETYNKLKQLSSKKMTTPQILALMGVFATNPEAGQKYVDNFNREKSDSLSILANLERDTIRFKKEGLAQYSQTKRAEIKAGEVQAREETKIQAKEYQQRVAMAADMTNEVVTQQGLPASVITAPTPEQLRDPDKFWTEWVPEFSKGVGTYIGKQNINKWLFDKNEGPGWLMQSALVDPANGVMQRLRETELYSEEELEIMNRTIIPEFTASVLRDRKQQSAELHKTEKETQVIERKVAVQEEQLQFYKRRLEKLDELSQGERVELMNDLAHTTNKLLESHSKHMGYAEFYANKKGYEGAAMSNLNAASQIEAQLAEMDLLQMQLKEQVGTENMLIGEAIPVAIQEALSLTIDYNQGLFASPQEALEVFYSEEDPNEPMQNSVRRTFYVNLLILTQMKTGSNFRNIAQLMNAGGPGESPLDIAAGQDITMPPGIATMAADRANKATE